MLQKLKQLLQKLKQLFKSPATAQSPTPTSPVHQSASPVLGLDTKEGWEAYRNSFVPSTRSFIHTWEEKLERDKRDAANSQGAPVDRSGFALTEANGWLVTPKMANNTPYVFTLGKSGTVKVSGHSGNQVNKVNGQGVLYAGEIPNQSGTITLAVESTDPSRPVEVRIV